MTDIGEGQFYQGGDDELSSPEGLLFTGEAIRALTPEQIEVIGEVASRLFGVEVRPIRGQEVKRLSPSTLEPFDGEEDSLTPVPFDIEHFKSWGHEHGYSKIRLRYAIDAIWNTGSKRAWAEVDPLPDLVFINESQHDEIDLRSVYSRLERTAMSTRAWKQYDGRHPSRDTVHVIVEYVNEQVQSDGPLDFNNARELPYPWP